jgi:DNA-directed RNA polymerase specialized sigma24 family protein
MRRPIEPAGSAPEMSDVADDVADTGVRFDCLERCLESLPAENRELILQYYLEEKRAKIDARKHLASQLGIPLNALRIRAHRIRGFLDQCVTGCMKDRGAEGS